MSLKIFGGALTTVACLAFPAFAAAPSTPQKPVPAPTSAKPYAVKRDAFGRPSLEGMWNANFLVTLQATKDAPTLTVSEAEAKVLAASRVKDASAFFDRTLDPEVPGLLKNIDGLPLVRGERRTRMITEPANGRLPLTPAGLKEMRSGPGEDKFDNPEDRPNAERCIVGAGQPPFAFLTFGYQVQIVQTRDDVVVHIEYGDDVRVIPFTDKHQSAAFKNELGDSIARWEGDTLVVETVRLPDGDRYRFFPSFIVAGDATLVERFTRVSAKEMLYQFTIIDPKVYSAPWSAEFSFYATDKLMYEHACHEGNYSLPGILAGARREETLPKPATVTAAITPAPH